MNSVLRAALVLSCAGAIAAPFVPTAAAAHFSAVTEAAVRFGVHEITLTGDGGVTNPFDTQATVEFVPPSGAAHARTVAAFYDGDNRWRARVYVSEPGAWRWTSASAHDPKLAGRSGTFSATDSKLRGRLLTHPRNPHHWMTEDGRWFLNLNDTAYFLLCAHRAFGLPVNEDDVKNYVRDVVARGITSVRSFTLVGPSGFLEDGAQFTQRWRESVFDDDAFSRFRLPHFRIADQRLRWLLDTYPDLYVQFILFSRGARYGRDDEMWSRFTPGQKERVLRYMVARYAAFPQIFWLVTNDAHYGEKFPNNNAFAREVGEYFRRHDPWAHPMSTGHARRQPYVFGSEPWSTYIHLEENFDVGALQCAPYLGHNKPVFLGEDRYEQDHLGDRDPKDMRYFQRRLFWAWLLSGGSTNYGGRWWDLVPYSQTGARASFRGPLSGGEAGTTAKAARHTAQLTGLDSVKFIRDYFADRAIELSDFTPDHGRVQDPRVTVGARTPRLMRRGRAEFLIYHPNATADDRNGTVARDRRVELVLDLADAAGKFAVEWCRAEDGAIQRGEPVAGGRTHTLIAPWSGCDCVVRVREIQLP